MLTLPWLIIMLLHGPNFWIWLIVPGSLYFIEKVLRYRKSRSNKHGETFIMEAILLPSQVKSSFLFSVLYIFFKKYIFFYFRLFI
jgi:hypothetical protein